MLSYAEHKRLEPTSYVKVVIKDTAKLYSPGELNDACEIKARVLIQRFVNCTPKLKDVLILEPILSD